MKNNGVKNRKIGEICNKASFASTYNDAGVMNFMPVPDSDGVPITQYISCGDNGAVFRTVVPVDVGSEDMAGMIDRIIAANSSMMFGSYDYDGDSQTLVFRSTMYCPGTLDIKAKEVKFHVGLGLHMALRFLKESNESEDSGTQKTDGPGGFMYS